MSTMTSFSVVLQPDVARRLVAAAAVAGVSVQDFVIGSAEAEADRVLAAPTLVPATYFHSLVDALDSPCEFERGNPGCLRPGTRPGHPRLGFGSLGERSSQLGHGGRRLTGIEPHTQHLAWAQSADGHCVATENQRRTPAVS